MTEVNRVMEKINSHCDGAKVIMGAAIDAGMANKLSVVLIAAKNSVERIEAVAVSNPAETNMVPGLPEVNRDSMASSPRFDPRLLSGSSAPPDRGSRPARVRRPGKNTMTQGQLPLTIVSRGRFDKSEPTIHKGEDLDIPTYIRRGVPLN